MKRIHVLATVLCVAILVSLLVGQEYFFIAATDNECLAVPGVAFHGETGTPSWNHILYQYLIGAPNSGYMYPNDEGEQVGLAPVYFPAGAEEFKGFKARMLDDEWNGTAWVSLYRKDFLTDEMVAVAGANTGFSFMSSSIETFEAAIYNPDSTEIDNSRYAWFLQGGFDQTEHQFDLQIHSVIIEYNKKLDKNK